MSVRRRTWLAAAGAALAAGCARDDPNALRFWAMGREGEVAGELLARFRAEHPEVRLRIEQLPWSAAHEKLLTAFAGDATPDVAQLGNTWLAELDAVGALEPLQPWLDATPSIAPADYFAGIWQTNVVGGRLVGVPWYVDTRLLFVRTDLLARAGWARPPADWAEWLRSMGDLKATAVPTPILLPTNEPEPLLALALQQGEPLLADGGRRGHFDSPGFRRALAFYAGMFERGFAAGLATQQIANVWQEFGRGRFAYYISGPWNLGEFARRLPAALQSSWATAPLPGPHGPGASTAGGSSLVLFRRSRAKPLAWKLVEYLARPAVQRRFWQLTGNLPPRRRSWALPGADGRPLAEDRRARAFADQLERARPAPAVPEWERIAEEMQLAAARVVAGRIGLDAALAGLDARVDAILEKRRWMLDRAARAAGG